MLQSCWMILTQTAEYALRCMAALAGLWPEERVTAKNLAQAASVPAAYTSKIMRKLVVAGLVDSSRGHHGGFLLTRDPTLISLLEVLTAIEFDLESCECAFGVGLCDPTRPCELHDGWSGLQRSFAEWARTTNLADTVPPTRTA